MGRGAKTGEEAADKYCFYIQYIPCCGSWAVSDCCGLPIFSAPCCKPALAQDGRVIPGAIHSIDPVQWGQQHTT
jgi:hypothetical protein